MTENYRSILDWNEQGEPISQRFNDIYFSPENGLAETNYVFLQNNYLVQRWLKDLYRQKFTIGETGFGTGLNFIATVDLWLKHSNPETNFALLFSRKIPSKA